MEFEAANILMASHDAKKGCHILRIPFIWVLIGFFLVVVNVLLVLVFYKQSIEQERNLILLSVGERIKIGMPIQEVSSLVDEFTSNQLQTLISENEYLLLTPTRWHAKNWQLYLLHDNEKVFAKLYRCADSNGLKPRIAPDDEMAPSYLLPSKFRILAEYPSN